MTPIKELIPTTVVPSGGYSYTQAETGLTLSADNIHQLIARVVDHRRANGLPVPFNIEDEVTSKVCGERPELCREADLSVPKSKPITLAMVLRITRTMFQAGFEREDQETADTRAAICASCDDNITPQGCTGCSSSAIKKAVAFVVGNRKTPHDSLLNSCKHCGCFNEAQVWIPLEALQSQITETENEALPDHCWKKR